MVDMDAAMAGFKSFVKKDEPLKKHCSFNIGGACNWFAEPTNLEEMINMLEFVRENNIPYKVIGNGTNILFSDSGFPGVIICTNKIADGVFINGSEVSVTAGMSLIRLIRKLQDSGLSGLEWLYGIPGTVGGALFMNAGSFGTEIGKLVKSATVYIQGKVVTLNKKLLNFGYRSSYFKEIGCIILEATFALQIGDKQEIYRVMQDIADRRNTIQPKGYSAGSVFKKTENYPAGLLIDQAGLKGTVSGGAKISGLHANFIINESDASAADVLKLIDISKDTVKQKFNLELIPEIEFIGDFK